MKQLFDETFSKNRTLWYGYFKDLEQADLIEKIKQIVQKDLETPNQVEATSWIFYREDIQKDALGEQIRSSIMVRFADGQYETQYNMSDFEFVVQRSVISAWLDHLEKQLNAQ